MPGKQAEPIRFKDDEEKEAAAMIVEALATSVRLEKYPKSLIDLHVTVLEVCHAQREFELAAWTYDHLFQDDGSVLAAAITCSALALADAGIEMTDVVAAATVVCLVRVRTDDHKTFTFGSCFRRLWTANLWWTQLMPKRVLAQSYQFLQWRTCRHLMR